MRNLLSKGNTNSKTIKNELETYILYLAPHTLNDKKINLCPWASKGCIKGCLNKSGMGVFSNVQLARIEKSNFFVNDKINFLNKLYKELFNINKKAKKQGKKIAIRLNGTSDIDFIALFLHKLNKDILNEFEYLLFYDYTKSLFKIEKYQASKYNLTFSRSEETTEEDIKKAINLGSNVSVVFSGNELPVKFLGTKVVDGDKSDLQMIFNQGKILGLKAKGPAKKDNTNFVVHV